ncbi:hypothetical protein [Propylenella binzhouense]|uniref:Uncharacterized protein n=1 Tax=Propylenella binzhouense TaxID=2555902 RepID=A0A964T8B9_9HYPH|nr:hypothetical protein [Propylenella binzhouense]MYZ50383.1 hypothetical protein [Propylenella binzhouense]
MVRYPDAPPTDWEAVRAAWEDFATPIDTICRRFGHSGWELKRRALAAGWRMRPPERPRVPAQFGGAPERQVDWPAVRKAYEARACPVRAILAEFGLRQSELRRRIEAEGWARRPGCGAAMKRRTLDRAEKTDRRLDAVFLTELARLERMICAAEPDHAAIVKLLEALVRLRGSIARGKARRMPEKRGAAAASAAELEAADIEWMRHELTTMRDRILRSQAGNEEAGV